MKKINLNSPRNMAMDYLSRREHSRYELFQKLSLKGFESVKITAVLDQLEKENLQNDSRFVRSYLNFRSAKGVGPVKIRYELNQKGVSEDIIEQVETEEKYDWYQKLELTAEKKYGSSAVETLKEKQKRTRFLLQRGFAMQDIMRLFN